MIIIRKKPAITRTGHRDDYSLSELLLHGANYPKELKSPAIRLTSIISVHC